jgi:hypothetical protein
MEADLNGTTPTAPHQIYMTPVGRDGLGRAMDGLDMLTGYVDASDQAHFIAEVTRRGDDGTHFKIIEQNNQTPGVDLPGVDSAYWRCPPTLLVDAQGRKHIVTMYQGGEHANVRDYLVGSDSEPTTIYSVTGTAGIVDGLEAIQ